MATVLIVEDDEDMQILLTERLSADYGILRAGDGVEALELVESGRADLVVADVMMPRMDGLEFVRRLREEGYTTPVILATAKQSFSDKREGFSAGADDYMTKPLAFEELKWRIEALLRRARIAADREIVLGDFRLSAASGECSYRGESIELAKKEFQLLYRLLCYPNKLFSKDKLLEEIWGYDSESDDTTLRTHVNRLRNKLESVTEFEIVTIRGLGYKAAVKGKK